MIIAVSGGTGFIGNHLIRHLLERGDEVVVVSRSDKPLCIHTSDGRQSEIRSVSWSRLERDVSPLEGIDGWVNLSGESINRRWTAAAKKEILESRLRTTGQVADVIARLERKPKVVVTGSGMSIYGTSETDSYDEDSPARNVDFLSSVVEQWERAADRIPAQRIVKLRVGLVLGSDGGALPPMMLPYKLFAGGRVGSGKQWLSWIHVQDMARLIAFCMDNEQIEGAVNGTGPKPATNDQFGRVLGRALGRPHYFPVPAFMLKLIFGELSVLLLEGQRVLPSKALRHGFQFRYNELEAALRDIAART
ncbi:TIGR01777 family oxidoreductase [Paenibacillus sp. MBLB4367]|uniref:TIGR01777 family oxidoreductase n=1 Tax=Paenibacillus sp. MBLB4367 TaxID=3384767 RepID=UPI003908083A